MTASFIVCQLPRLPHCICIAAMRQHTSSENERKAHHCWVYCAKHHHISKRERVANQVCAALQPVSNLWSTQHNQGLEQ